MSGSASFGPFFYCDSWSPKGGGKCVASIADADMCFGGTNGRYVCTGIAKYTGAQASNCEGSGGNGEEPADMSPKPTDGLPPNEPKEGTAAPAACPTGQAPGEVNGVRVCMPMGKDDPTTEKAPGNGKKEEKNPDGSSTTTEQSGTTKCKDGVCSTTTTTTTTTKDASGNVTGSTSKDTTTTQSKGEFCSKNANSKQCTGEGTGKSSFAGNCHTGFVAISDDAVTNAMAQEQHKRNCETLRTDTEPSTWLQAEGQRTDDRTAGNPHNETVNVGPSGFDSTDALGGGGCSLNKTITVAGHKITLPFNVLCNPLEMLGWLLVAVSFLLAARIVTRG